MFRALADPTRRAVFEQLTRGEATVGQLVKKFDVSQPAISQHLGALREAALVKQRRCGRNTYWRVETRGLAPLVSWIEHYQVFWLERLAKLETLVENLDD
ncbi:MAG TPA: metalloregulator ArsR/SmtB family transcription factor [Kofleriaceae bacterium]